MMWCLRIVMFAVLFSGKIMGRETVTISEIPDAVYLTTTLTIYDGTATPTDSVKPSTSSSTIQSLGPSPSPPPPPPPPAPLPAPAPALAPAPISPSPPLSPPSKYSSSFSSQSSTFTTQTITQTTVTDSHSHITTTTTSTPSGAPATKQSETPPPSSITQSTPINAAQIAGIAIGSGAIFSLVATIFFFFGRRNACPIHNDRRLSVHNVGAGLGSVKTKFSKIWKRRPKQQQAQRSQGAATPAELTATVAPREEPSPPVRPVNNLPYFYHPVTTCATEELGGSSTASHNPFSTSRQQTQQDEILPVELPTSLDPGNSPLPRYEELDTAGRYRVFSWAAPESAYRPDKFEPGNKI